MPRGSNQERRTAAVGPRPAAPADWTRLRLPDHVRPGLRVLFIGINPGVRSAIVGHHFAGYSNRFWKLLYESKLVPAPIGWEQDAALLDWGFGITNLIERPTPGVSDLRPEEYRAGRRRLARKIQRLRPRVVALVGVTLYRAILPEAAPARRGTAVGLRPETLHGAHLFVLPNPSGRNAHFTHAEMLRAFAALRRHLERESRQSSGTRSASREKPKSRSAPRAKSRS